MDNEADDLWEIRFARIATAESTEAGLYLNHHLYGEPDTPARTDYHLWVLRGRTRTILIDTGFTAETGVRRGKELLGEVAEFWRSAGVDPSEPQEVILSHLHWDHAGNLAMLDDPRVTLAQAELEFWTSPRSQGFLISHYAEPKDVATLVALVERGRVHTFTGSLAYAPGVELLEVGGHTPGQVMVKVRTSLGPVLLASDAVHFSKELWEDRPFTAVTDLPGMYAGLALVRELLRSGEVVRVLTGHDPGELEQEDVHRTGEHTGVIAPLPRNEAHRDLLQQRES